MRIQTALTAKDYSKFKQKCQEKNVTPYKLAQQLIKDGINNHDGKTPLSCYSTKELAAEIWNRIP